MLIRDESATTETTRQTGQLRLPLNISEFNSVCLLQRACLVKSAAFVISSNGEFAAPVERRCRPVWDEYAHHDRSTPDRGADPVAFQ